MVFQFFQIRQTVNRLTAEALLIHIVGCIPGLRQYARNRDLHTSRTRRDLRQRVIKMGLKPPSLVWSLITNRKMFAMAQRACFEVFFHKVNYKMKKYHPEVTCIASGPQPPGKMIVTCSCA